MKDLMEDTEGRIILEVINGKSITKDAIRVSYIYLPRSDS